MSLGIEHNYDLYVELASLSQLLDDYQQWYAAVLDQACYAEAAPNRALPAAPSLFIESLSAMPEHDLGGAHRAELNALDQQHHTLQAIAAALTKANTHQNFLKFTDEFRAFIRGLQKTCQSLILEEWGLDILTGLKNKRAMGFELSREMERLARHGQPFALSLVRIDNFKSYQSKYDPLQTDMLTKRAAGFISASLRSFDDAYTLGNGEFILCLKQAGINGGQKAMERLRAELDKQNLTGFLAIEQDKLTMSCCVAEPLPDDNVIQLIDNLRSDLEANSNDPATVLTYFELSPLQKFVNSGQRD